MQHHNSKHFALRPTTSPPLQGSTGQNQLFQNMVISHIKLRGIAKHQQHGSKCFARIPPLPTTLGDGVRKVKNQLLQNMVMLHIKLIGITKCSKIVANILPAYPTPFNLGVKMSKYNFFRTWSSCISN